MIARIAATTMTPFATISHVSLRMKSERVSIEPERTMNRSSTFAPSQRPHHQPITLQVPTIRPSYPPWLAFHSSRTVWNGLTRFANGTNHHPTAHPGVNSELPVGELDRVPLRAVLPHTPHDPRHGEQDDPSNQRRHDQRIGVLDVSQCHGTARPDALDDADPIDQGKRFGAEQEDLREQQCDERVGDPLRRAKP